jgi:hypothetical protein
MNEVFEENGRTLVLHDPFDLQGDDDDASRAWMKYLRDNGWFRKIGKAPTNEERSRLLLEAHDKYENRLESFRSKNYPMLSTILGFETDQ